MSVDWRVILQWSAALSSNGTCLTFSNVPVVEPIQIAIVGEAGRENDAASMFRSLENTIQQLSGAAGLVSQCGIPRLLGCKGRDEPTCRSVLVVILSNQPVSSQTAQLMTDWLTSGPVNRVVLPVIPAGADPKELLPGQLNKLVVLWDTNGINSLAPDVLRAAGVSGDQFRLFISYRRADAQDLADQLFDRFSQEGFDVFLDRFRGTPGRAFPPQLSEALIDKGLIVAIESPNVWMSQWTVAEVAFANQYRLGLLSILMPGGQKFSVITRNERFDTSSSDWIPGGGSTSPTLDQTALDGFVQFVRDRYALQLLRRRVYLETLLNLALIPHSITPDRQSNGVHVVTGANRYSIELASRQPALENVRRAAESGLANSSCAVVVGPKGFRSPRTRSDFDWLFGRTNVACTEETDMTNLASRMAMGVRLP